MALATAAAIAALASAGTGIYAATQGGRGAGQRQDYTQQQLADARQNVINAQIAAAQTGKLAQAGYQDPTGGGFRYDPATNQWVSTLGPEQQQAQRAADQASIGRNTTDMWQAQRANAMAERNAVASQPMIDAARRRMEEYQPMSGDELTSLLSQTAANANTDAYRPVVQDTLRQFTRTGSNAGPVLADIGKRSSADLRQGMIDARLKGITGADQINNTRMEGLRGNLTAATQAGTPSFQYPGMQARTDNKDLLAAMTNRAGGAAAANAAGQRGVNDAMLVSGRATGAAVDEIPFTDPSVSRLERGMGEIGSFLKSNEAKGLYGSMFGPAKKEKDWGTNY